MGCINSKRKARRVAPIVDEEKTAEVTVVEAIYLPLSLQPFLEEPRKRETEEEVLKELEQDGLLKCETLKEKKNGNVAFFVSLDGNAFPSGKPRLLEPIELKQEREKSKANLNNKMSNANRLRRESLRKVKKKARIASARQRQAMAKREQADVEHRRVHKQRLEIKMERALKNRQTIQAGGK